MSARDTILLALTRYYQANADPRGTAAQVLTGYDTTRRAETLNERTDARDRMCRDAHTAGHTTALTEGARLLEDAACDADWDRAADYCAGLRAGAELLLAKTAGTTAPPNAEPTFFQRGHTYAREHHGRTIEFRVIHIATAPDCEFPTAFGWRKDPEIDVMLPMDSDDFHGCGWTDVTEAEGGRG